MASISQYHLPADTAKVDLANPLLPLALANRKLPSVDVLPVLAVALLAKKGSTKTIPASPSACSAEKGLTHTQRGSQLAFHVQAVTSVSPEYQFHVLKGTSNEKTRMEIAKNVKRAAIWLSASTKNDKPSPKGPTPKDIRQKLNKLKVTKSESLSELKRDMQKKKRSLGKLSSLKSVVKAEQQAARERIVRW